MSTFGRYITAGEAKAMGDKRSVSKLEKLARSNAKCSNCDEPAWRYGGCGLCFTCTTGQSDMSEDCELYTPQFKVR